MAEFEKLLDALNENFTEIMRLAGKCRFITPMNTKENSW